MHYNRARSLTASKYINNDQRYIDLSEDSHSVSKQMTTNSKKMLLDEKKSKVLGPLNNKIINQPISQIPLNLTFIPEENEE